MRDTDNGQPALWMGLLVAMAILFSLTLACGMPFAALGALAALTLAPRDALLLAGLGWLANQAIGFGLMGYPLDPRTLAWGVALGLSALAAAVAAGVALRLTRPVMQVPLALVAAVIGQQGTVFAASLVLGASTTAFAPAVLWMILWTNALAFALLLLAQAAGARLGLARPVRLQAAA